MEREKCFKSVFVEFPDKYVWMEFVTKYSKGTKKKNSVKFEASRVWCSDSSFSIFSDLRGSFNSDIEAYEYLVSSVSKFGGEIPKMNKKVLSSLEKEFNYPEGRHSYLLGEAVI